MFSFSREKQIIQTNRTISIVGYNKKNYCKKKKMKHNFTFFYIVCLNSCSHKEFDIGGGVHVCSDDEDEKTLVLWIFRNHWVPTNFLGNF